MSRYIDERNVQSSPQGFNAETEKIARTQEDHLSRYPTQGPNAMHTPLDMNSEVLYNLPFASTGTEAVPLRQVQSLVQTLRGISFPADLGSIADPNITTYYDLGEL